MFLAKNQFLSKKVIISLNNKIKCPDNSMINVQYMGFNNRYYPTYETISVNTLLYLLVSLMNIK